MRDHPHHQHDDDQLDEWVDAEFEAFELLPLPDHFLSETMAHINPPAIEPFRIGWVELTMGLLIAASGTVILTLITLILSGEWVEVWNLMTQPRISMSAQEVIRLTIISTCVGILSFLLLLPSDRTIARLFRLQVNQA